MKFIPAGKNSAYTAIKEPPLKNDFDEWLVRIVCFAFSYPVAAFVSLNNRSIAEQGARQAELEGLEPLKAHIAELVNDVIEREFDDTVEFAWLEEQEIDPKIQADILTSYVSGGILTVNQARKKLGELADPSPAANQLMAMTQSGFVPIGGSPTDTIFVDDTTKVAKVAIAMVPPAGQAPFRMFKLQSGNSYEPNFVRGGEVTVTTEADAAELVAEGWTRAPKKGT